MPLDPSSGKSLAAGAPIVERRAHMVRVVQSRLVGRALVAIGGGIPAAILYAERDRIGMDWWGYFAHRMSELSLPGTIGLGLLVTLLALMLVYGLFWLVWRRELIVDLKHDRYRFVTGIPPWTQRLEGSSRTPLILQCGRKLVTSRTGVGGEAGTAVAGRTTESWELRLALPGGTEPLFLGEWGERADAEREIAGWQEIFPRLSVDRLELGRWSSAHSAAR